jgi:pectate lyase
LIPAILGTSGGIGGATTTVSSLAALKTAVADDTARIVWVSGNAFHCIPLVLRLITSTVGTITGNEAVKVGSNKSILGLSGASKLSIQ